MYTSQPDRFDIFAPQPVKSSLTKQVDQVHYEIPRSKYATPWSSAPEFLKVFGDTKVYEGQPVVFDCVLLGSPRPRVTWLFNDRKLPFGDVDIQDTADVCRLKIARVRPEHFGRFTVVAENEIGRAVASAQVIQA